MRTRTAGQCAAATVLAWVIGAAAGSAVAQTPARLDAGTLVCKVSEGTGLVFGSTKQLDCLFNNAGAEERYDGTIMKYGIDIGSTSASVIVWSVLSSTTTMARGALSGTYSGVAAEATVGLGVGANALLGGSGQSVVLQPLSGQVQQGLNIAAGIATIRLTPR